MGAASKRKKKGDLKQYPADYLHVFGECVEEHLEENTMAQGQGNTCEGEDVSGSVTRGGKGGEGRKTWQHLRRSLMASAGCGQQMWAEGVSGRAGSVKEQEVTFKKGESAIS